MKPHVPLGNYPAAIPVAAAVVSSLFFVVLVAYLPIAILANAGHDDAWFWQRAHAMVSGSWMGSYNHYTLMKGAGYPLFLAINHLTGLPLSVSQALLYSVACLLLAHAVLRVSGRPWLALLLLVLVQWHPMALSWSRIVRDNVSAAQVLLIVAGMLLALHTSTRDKHRWVWGAFSGWVLAWFWLTREDGIWLLPALTVLITGMLVCSRPRLRQATGPLLAFLAGFLVLTGLVGTVNWSKYGRFETVDFKDSAFKDAVGALQRVRVGKAVAHVPVPVDVRERIYAQSPTFALLRPYLEGQGRSWMEPGCAIYAHACGDYAGGWFVWALRDAVALEGGYATASVADAFYRRIAQEVGAACTDGRLECRAGAGGFMPAVPVEQWNLLPSTFWNAARLLAWQDAGEEVRSSSGGAARVGEMWRFVGKPKVPADPELVGRWVAGWFHSPQGAWLALGCDESPAVPVERRPSPDLVANFRDPAATESRFEIRLPDQVDCRLQVVSQEHVPRSTDLMAGTEAMKHLVLDEGDLYFDSLGEGLARTAFAPGITSTFRRHIGRAYGWGLPVVLMAGLLAFAWGTLQAIRSRRLGVMLVLAATAWTAVLCRMALLSLVEVASFPAVHVQYMQPAFPLGVLAAVASLALLLPGLQRTRNVAP